MSPIVWSLAAVSQRSVVPFRRRTGHVEKRGRWTLDKRRTATRQGDRMGGPDYEQTRDDNAPARATAARRVRNIKLILPLKFNLVQPRDRRPTRTQRELHRGILRKRNACRQSPESLGYNHSNHQAHSRDGGAYISIAGEKGNGNKG